ncbi:RNA modification enzyme, MiaB family [Desulfofarcimen acetoxidans DSM 771]|uniref:Threonylcarbamoyladenosine tRNA methylthiotransferase MtaB n=1 Tax=Desulfofarcimen acetoxidans (strain ATCC 49208 / DSM 771 / KCTC 5769 / VKM B-1644 / 5575) TaxID=485916 RepID=C8W4S1_DESAS|nr:tRNA (N(6)-L-threonylcarbamoyladenosine(37)-C(2))-methylthiotransferase MtaB [Desulfofarcimen acetoxidans]ACV63957.1 RNA modification enzyme, MiaB family [Desulfofarcimen acetoxidans DSM 771]
MKSKTVAVATLGCKVNQYEAAAIVSLFRSKGYSEVDFTEPAGVYVINTCTVTHLSDRKSRQLIRRAVRTNPEAVIAVTGCYAQTSPGELMSLPEVDLVVGTSDRDKIVDLVEASSKAEKINAVADIEKACFYEELPAPAGQGRVRAYLKIQEGCRNFCSYCIIPYARGPLRSRQPEAVLNEAESLLAAGFKEIVLTGIQTGAYGVDLPAKTSLAAIVEKLLRISGLSRLRLSSIEPNDLSPELIELILHSKIFCPHLHIPLQSGSDRVLKLMRRRYTTEGYAKILNNLREKMPNLAVTTDIMAGFPGETEEDFEQALGFIKDMAFSGMHVFKYSPRRGTPAAGFPQQVDARVKEQRSRRLIALGEQLTENYASKFAGLTLPVLAEQPFSGRGGCWEGLTPNYLRVVFACLENLSGEIIDIKIEKTGIQYQTGIII